MGREQRANAGRREAIRKLAEHITGRAVDDGQIVALGFATFIEMGYPNWERMQPEQLEQLRMAFFGGAQHLFASINSMLDPGPDTEPTEQDLRRMTLIDHELQAFIEEFRQRHGITDPDVGPEQETKQ